MGLSDWFKGLFKKKIEIYVAIGHEDYFWIINKLNRNGVRYQTKIPVVARKQDYFTEQNKQYSIYVYEEDQGKAVKAINENR